MDSTSSGKDQLTSPLTGGKVVLEKNLRTQDVIEKYKKAFSIDVARFFEKAKDIAIYKCVESGYRFYHPFYVDGDGRFYEHFQQYDWYYMPWKWEHEIASSYVAKNANVLEVGCGRGEFLEGVKKKNGTAILKGLELNLEAVKNANNRGLDVLPELVQSHAESNSNKYDLVCSFQVLEHISEVRSFLEAEVKALKSGGKLIIAVPNNDSFTKYDWENDILNMPPHHMGLWTRASLTYLTKVFPLKVVQIIDEPLQSYHQDWFVNVTQRRIVKSNGLFASLYYRLGLRQLLSAFAKLNARNISGHSILAIFEKV